MLAISLNPLGNAHIVLLSKTSGWPKKVYRFNQFSAVAAHKNYYIDRNGTGTTNARRTAAASGMVTEAEAKS